MEVPSNATVYAGVPTPIRIHAGNKCGVMQMKQFAGSFEASLSDGFAAANFAEQDDGAEYVAVVTTGGVQVTEDPQ